MALLLFTSEYLVFFILLAAAVYGLRLPAERRMRFVITAFLAFVLAYLLSKLAGHFYVDTRPGSLAPKVPSLFHHLSQNGFPSSHTVFCTVTASLVAAYSWKSGRVLLLLTLIVGISRVAAGFHSPVDIIGGLLVGALATAISLWLVQKYLPRLPRDRGRRDAVA